MAAFFVLLVYLAAGVLCAWVFLWDKSPLLRCWIGLCFGLLLLMWLPALAAFFVRFTLLAQAIAFGALLLLCAVACYVGRKHGWRSAKCRDGDRKLVIALLCFAAPLTLLMGYLQYTHTLREVNGALHTGQSTYGDLCMHLSIITGLRGSALPAEYNILPGSTLGYPLLTDAMSTSLYMLGMPLALTISLPGTLMSALVFSGVLILAYEMTGKISSAVIAGVLLFFNGGLGFLYNFDLPFGSLSKLEEIFTGYYKTPANLPDLNLRWSNLVADLLLPQRTFLGGWVLLLPAFYLVREAIQKGEMRMFLLTAVFGAALPMVHTHSFLALGLYSGGALVYKLATDRGLRKQLLIGASVYLGSVPILALPQLLVTTLHQATTEGFIKLHFNWVNNTSVGMIDFYPWFWLKNIGLPLIVMLCALVDFRKEDRMDFIGATCIFVVAETVLFQPLDYDNNKLFYIWFLLMLPAVGRWCVSLWNRLLGKRSRALIAVLFLTASTLSGGLSIIREVISDYQLFSSADVQVAKYIEENTDPADIFLTGLHHNNPVYTLAGRKVVCGPDNFLWTHGLNYLDRQNAVKAFFEDPARSLDMLETYSVDYIVVGWPERSQLKVNEVALDSLFPIVYQQDDVTVYEVINTSAESPTSTASTGSSLTAVF